MLGSGETFRFGLKFWVQARNLGENRFSENFGFGQKICVWVKILGLGKKFGFGQKFWVCILHFAFPAKNSEFFRIFR